MKKPEGPSDGTDRNNLKKDGTSTDKRFDFSKVTVMPVPQAPTPIKKKGNSEPPDVVNQSTQLWDMIKEGYFFADLTENAYYVDSGIPIDIGSEDFLDGLTNRFYAVEGKLPSPEALNSVRRMARFTAKQNVRDVQPRVSRAGDSFVFDPLNPDGSVYVITKEGVNLRTPKRPLTIRFKGMLKAEVLDGTKDDLTATLGLWNLTDGQTVLLIGDIGASFVAGIPQAILVLTGEQGAGKTTMTRALKEIVDPNAAPSTSLRADQEANLVLSMLHQRTTAFDNVNGVMPQGVSDILCSAATGNGFRTRQLYTNSGEFIAQIQRKLIVNGINESNYNGDFQERSLHIHLSEIDVKARIPDKTIKKELSNLIPKVRGFFLNKMVDAINLYDQVAKELNGKLPRMADYTIWGECFVRVMGFENGSFLKAFTNAQDMDVMENSAEDITVKAIHDLIRSTDKGVWAGTTSDLLNALMARTNEYQHTSSEKIPNTPRKLGRRLTQIAPMLRKMKIRISEQYDSKIDENHKIKVIEWIEEG